MPLQCIPARLPQSVLDAIDKDWDTIRKMSADEIFIEYCKLYGINPGIAAQLYRMLPRIQQAFDTVT